MNFVLNFHKYNKCTYNVAKLYNVLQFNNNTYLPGPKCNKKSGPVCAQNGKTYKHECAAIRRYVHVYIHAYV